MPRALLLVNPPWYTASHITRKLTRVAVVILLTLSAQARAVALQIPEAEMMRQRVEFEEKCISSKLAVILRNLKLHTRMAC